VLRPRMYEVLAQDEFVVEAMSTSYVSRIVMERFKEVLPDFEYRRVAVNAKNPDFEANELERKLISYFQENPGERNWQGIVSQDGRSYYMRFQPVLFEQSCMRCHGEPGDAPPALLGLYGSERGFYRDHQKELALASVGIPVDISLLKIKETAWIVFGGAFLITFLLFGVICLYFHKVVVQNLRGLLEIFRSALRDEEGRTLYEQARNTDEIGELANVAEIMAQHLEDHAQNLLRGKELLQTVFDGITDLVALLDGECRIKMVNQAFLRRYRASYGDVLHKRCRDLPGAPCPFVGSTDLKGLGVLEAVTRETRLASGEIFEVHFYPIFDDDGDLQNIVCYGKDVTAQKRLALQTQQTEKMAAIGQLAAGVAHEINNPLGVILCYADLLKEAHQDRPEELADLRIIEKHALNCKRIVADLLNFARHQEQIRRLVSINQVIEESLSLVAAQFRKRQVEIKTDLAAGLPQPEADEDLLKQVFLNLFMNAGQAIAGSGSIKVTSRLLDESRIAITVEDNGCGIAPDQLDRIFDPFYTTKEPGEGTGLGLSVSYGIIRDHGGEITVESNLGAWTRLTVILPVEQQGDSEADDTPFSGQDDRLCVSGC
jgi:two-component system, NtrC family, sensor kinase